MPVAKPLWYKCRRLSEMKALKRIRPAFPSDVSAKKGCDLVGPVDWLKHAQEKVEALEMDFVVINAGSATALWAEIGAARQVLRSEAHRRTFLGENRKRDVVRRKRDDFSLFPGLTSL